MFINTVNRAQFRPPQEILEKACDCIKIERNDRWSAEKALSLKEIRNWARENTESFIWWELEGWNDPEPVDRPEVWLFYFYKPEDATMFRLRWL